MSSETVKIESNKVKLENLYQIQMDGLKKGWLIYPNTLNPLTLTIEKRKTKTKIFENHLTKM